MAKTKYFYTLLAMMSLALCVLPLAGCLESGSGGGTMVVSAEDCIAMALSTTCVPQPGALINGSVSQALSGATGTKTYFASTTGSAGIFYVDHAQMPAIWNSWTTAVQWGTTPFLCGNWQIPGFTIYTPVNRQDTITLESPLIDWECVATNPSPADRPFSLAESLPSTLTVGAPAGPLSSAYAMPRLNVYAQPAGIVAQATATSVAPDGSTATFAFPQLTAGGTLTPGLYMFSLWSAASPGVFDVDGVGFFSVGSRSTSRTTPYGVDAFDVGTSQETWTDYNGVTSDSVSNAMIVPNYLLTLASPGQLCVGTSPCINVGSQPTAVKAYNITTTVQN